MVVKNMDKETKQMFDLVLQKLEGIDKRQENMEKSQGEMYIMQRGLEENAKVTRANQDKMAYTLADIQGIVKKLSIEVEEHESIISQIKTKKIITI